MGKVFISYRRVDSDFAHRLREKLGVKLDDTIFIDVEIREQFFIDAIENALIDCHALLLIVTPNTLKPTLINQPNDWIYYELKTALSLKKPIVPALEESVSFPLNTDLLPVDIQIIGKIQGVRFPEGQFEEKVEALADHLVSISHGALRRRLPTHVSCEKIRRGILQKDDQLHWLSTERPKNKADRKRLALRREELLVERALLQKQLNDCI
jgi:hypothetical protein